MYDLKFKYSPEAQKRFLLGAKLIKEILIRKKIFNYFLENLMQYFYMAKYQCVTPWYF